MAFIPTIIRSLGVFPVHTKLVDEAEIAQLSRALGRPYRHHVTLPVEHTFFQRWGEKFRTRRGEVLFLLPRPGGLLVHRKHHYPARVWRLLTGGVELGEGVLDALHREVREEVGYTPEPRRFVALVTYHFVHGEAVLPFVTYMFLMSYSRHPLLLGTDGEVAETREVSLDELADIADALGALPGEWADWGRFRAVVHRLAATLLRPDDLAPEEDK